MTHVTDRDPIDALTLAFAVDAWAQGDHEADIDLEAVLLDQGVIRPDEVIHELQPGAAGIHVVLDCGTEFTLTTDGQVL